ncbi:alpha/beta hydrolase [Myxococcaceae bacterium JPH2]|nr:alpha/beta hydrolase [Myxococcaceae bacterium JPH2]
MIQAATSALLMLSLSTATPPPASEPRASRYERTACGEEVAKDEPIECGVLSVPENRGKPASRMIQLPVMRLRSRAEKPGIPFVFLPGGPGVSAVDRQRSGKTNPIVEEHDFILLEPRGGKHAQPNLECPEINALTAEASAGRLRGKKLVDALVGAAGRCRATLTGAGVDLDGYTTEAIADDLEDLRRALGIEKWSLMGLSYGARPMLELMRRHPEGIQSAIMDSVFAPNVVFDEYPATNLMRSLNLVFDGCAADPECGAAYPQLRAQFARLISSADTRPLALGLDLSVSGGRPLEIRGAQVADALATGLHQRDTIPRLPRIISRAASGHPEELAALVKDTQGPSSFTWGLRLSVTCAEENPFANVARATAQLSPAMGLGGIDGRTVPTEVCRVWNVSPAPARMKELVRSDIPTLIYAGEFDPDTPPDWGRQLLENMPHAYFVEMRGLSHGAGFNLCGRSITLAFLRDPTHAPPVDCALQLRGADFGQSAKPPPPSP